MNHKKIKNQSLSATQLLMRKEKNFYENVYALKIFKLSFFWLSGKSHAHFMALLTLKVIKMLSLENFLKFYIFVWTFLPQKKNQPHDNEGTLVYTHVKISSSIMQIKIFISHLFN